MVYAMTIMCLNSRLTFLAIDVFVTYGDMFGYIVKKSVIVFLFISSYLIVLLEQTTQGFFFYKSNDPRF